MDLLFEQLSAFAHLPGKVAIYRETSAQHFEKTGSYAGSEQAQISKSPPISPPCRLKPHSQQTLPVFADTSLLKSVACL